MFYFSVLVTFICVLQQVTGKPLDDYIAKPDDVFGYEELSDYNFRDEDWGVTVYILNMTSQQWKTDSFVSISKWYHYMAVAVPDDLDPNTNSAGLFISMGKNRHGPPTLESDYFLMLTIEMANKSSSIVTLLNQIPNQNLVFASDPLQRSLGEDKLISYSWRRFVVEEDAADPENIIFFPMTKAVIRAMDVVQEFTNVKLSLNIERFLLSGASKRGWVTFLAAATDPKNRVFAIAPMVFSVLNTVENLLNHYRALGGWSWPMRPYYNENLTMVIDTPNSYEMMEHVDPYSYRDRLTMPMYVFLATGDEFFRLDETTLWWGNMTNEKHLLMLQNTNHPMPGHHGRLLDNYATYYNALIKNFKLPQLSWELSASEGKGSIILHTDTQPLEVFSYWANTTSGDRRDFRLLVAGPGEDYDLNPVFWKE